MIRITKFMMSRSRLCNFKRYNVTTAAETLSIADMPHPTELPIFGTKLALFAAGSGTMLHKYVDDRHKQLGPIFYDKLGGNTKIVFTSDPNLMKILFLNLEGKYPAHFLPEPWVLYEKLYGSKRGLFFMNGEEWLTNRRVLNKHVLKENSEKWLEVPIKCTVDDFIQRWKNKAENGSFLPDLESELYRFSTDVIINVLLGSKCLERSPYYDELVVLFSESVKRIFETTTKLHGLPLTWYQRLNLKQWRDFKECVDTSIFFGRKIVKEMLVNKENNKGLIKRLCEENVSDEVITRIIADFIIAAGDTTAYTTLWILYLLANNEDEKKEIRIKGLIYVKYVIKEAMRLYPVAPFITRILDKETTLGNYKLPERIPIAASIYTSGRAEINYSQADKFAPYRWDRNDPRKVEFINHVPSASLPFALGSRSCIGKKIAMLQLAEIVYQIVNNFEFKCENAGGVSATTSQVLIPSKKINIKISLREE